MELLDESKIGWTKPSTVAQEFALSSEASGLMQQETEDLENLIHSQAKDYEGLIAVSAMRIVLNVFPQAMNEWRRNPESGITEVRMPGSYEGRPAPYISEEDAHKLFSWHLPDTI